MKYLTAKRTTASAREKWRGKELLVHVRGEWKDHQANPLVSYDKKKVINLNCNCATFVSHKECEHVAGLILHLIAQKQTQSRNRSESAGQAEGQCNQSGAELGGDLRKEAKGAGLGEEARKKQRLQPKGVSTSRRATESRLW